MTVKKYMELGADAAAPGSARSQVSDALSGRDDGTVATATLLVSELVSNAVLHGSKAGDSVGVELSVEPDRIRIEVFDVGDGFDYSNGSEPGALGGFGLRIVEDLAAAWGIDRGPPHKVWCELTTH